MAELLDSGGCYNSMRFAVDGAGVNARNWRGAINTNQEFVTTEILILGVSFSGDDMNAAAGATFKIQWANNTDSPTTWNDLAATGEIKWATTSDLVNGASLNTAAWADPTNIVDCIGKSWSVKGADSQEREGGNGITADAQDDELLELHWAIALDSADSGDVYQFRVTESGGTVIGTGTGLLTVVQAGKIDGTTKDSSRGSAVGGVTVSAYLSDNAGTDPKPVGSLVAQTVSNASTGAYSLTGLAAGENYFLHFYKDDTDDLSDGSPVVTAVAV